MATTGTTTDAALLDVLTRLAERLDVQAVPLLLDAEGAVAYSGLSRRGLYAATSSGSVPVVETPCGRRWRKADLDRWIAAMKPARKASRRGGYRPRRVEAAVTPAP